MAKQAFIQFVAKQSCCCLDKSYSNNLRILNIEYSFVFVVGIGSLRLEFLNFYPLHWTSSKWIDHFRPLTRSPSNHSLNEGRPATVSSRTRKSPWRTKKRFRRFGRSKPNMIIPSYHSSIMMRRLWCQTLRWSRTATNATVRPAAPVQPAWAYRFRRRSASNVTTRTSSNAKFARMASWTGFSW